MLFAAPARAALAAEVPDIQGGDVTADAETNIAEGTWGTCPWVIDAQGTLTIWPGIGVNTDYWNQPGWHAWRESVTSVRVIAEGASRVRASESCFYLFAELENAASIDLSGLDTSSVTGMGHMFDGCSSLASIDLSGLDTSSVKDMGYMFWNCSSLASIDLSGLDTSSVADMSGMFAGCSSLASIDLSGLDTSSVGRYYHMFAGCSSLGRVAAGAKYEIRGVDMFPNATAKGGKWYSSADGRWYSKKEVVAGRSKVADTYLDRDPKDPTSSDGGASDVYVGDISNPRMKADSSMESGRVVTWDCLWFGSYPQTEIAPNDAMYAQLKSADWDANGDTTVGGSKYCRISKSDATNSHDWTEDGYGSVDYRYFRYEPIKWRVLEVSGSTAFVLADRALDGKQYNAEGGNITWSASTVRSWLNGYGATSNQQEIDYSSKSFISTAFSSDEASAILTTDVANPPSTLQWSGPDTEDKIFLLSAVEADVSTYGFESGGTNIEARRCRLTDYAHAMGASYSTEYKSNCSWWLRTVGSYAFMAAYVDDDGTKSTYGHFTSNKEYAVRPAMNVDLASAHLSWAGTVSSDGSVNERAVPGGDVEAPSFSDVTGELAHEEDIAWLASTGISKGWDNGDGTASFRPYVNVARADMAAFLFRLAKSWGVVEEGWRPSGSASFADVTSKTAHHDEIMWLAESGISRGWDVAGGRKEFRPYADVARADMAAFIGRLAALAKIQSPAPTGLSFADVDGATAHREEIQWLADSGVSKGWDNGDGTSSFRPYASVARADMAAFLHRLDGLRG